MTLTLYEATKRIREVIGSCERIDRELTYSEGWSPQLGAELMESLSGVETELARLRNDVIQATKPWTRS